jgi:hypothetical protein
MLAGPYVFGATPDPGGRNYRLHQRCLKSGCSRFRIAVRPGRSVNHGDRARRTGHCPFPAQDTAQDAFLAAWQGLSGFRRDCERAPGRDMCQPCGDSGAGCCRPVSPRGGADTPGRAAIRDHLALSGWPVLRPDRGPDPHHHPRRPQPPVPRSPHAGRNPRQLALTNPPSQPGNPGGRPRLTRRENNLHHFPPGRAVSN